MAAAIDPSSAIARGVNNALGLYNLFKSESFDIPDGVFDAAGRSVLG